MVDVESIIRNIPENGRVVIKCECGNIVCVRNLADNEHIATISALIDIAKMAGYIVLPPKNSRT